MKTKFRPGDVVRLKSGGPPMTVQVVARSSGYVLCMYADDASVIRDTPWLAPDTLESEET